LAFLGVLAFQFLTVIAADGCHVVWGAPESAARMSSGVVMARRVGRSALMVAANR
jgi:hypothetical protein